MKQFVLCLALALCINTVAGRAVTKKAEKHEEHPPEQQDDVAVIENFQIIRFVLILFDFWLRE